MARLRQPWRQRPSASDTNFRCCKGKWFRLRKPGLHRFLISGPDLGIDASFSPFSPSFVHRFLISSPDLRIDASFPRFKPSFVHRFLISSPDLRIDARISPKTTFCVHRFLISEPNLGIDASFSRFKPSCVHRFLISGPDLRIDAAPSLLHRRMARLQHSRGGAGRDRMPRRRHNPKKKAAGVAPVPAATTCGLRFQPVPAATALRVRF